MSTLTYREALLTDITALHIIRNAVKENVLSNPDLVKEKDYEEFLTNRGKGWVCEDDDHIVGFAIVDVANNNVWALFVHPGHEKKGIGKKLHKLMLDWYFQQTAHPLWLSTDPGTRAELFYRQQGWKEAGWHGKEIRFEMEAVNWK